MAYFSFIFFERLSPLRCIDELYSNLVDIFAIYSNEGQEKSVWFEGTRDGFSRGLYVIDPVKGAEANNSIKLSYLLELSV